jgi:hypothetical protein
MEIRKATTRGIFGILAFCGVLIGCNPDQKPYPAVQISSSRIDISDELKEMSDLFLDSLNGQKTYREVVINKVLDSQYIMTFRAFQPNQETLKMAAPLLFYVLNSSDTIFVNTGAEELLRGDMKGVGQDAFVSRDNVYLCMEFDFDGRNYVLNKTCAQPFAPELKYIDPPSIDISRFLPDSSAKN